MNLAFITRCANFMDEWDQSSFEEYPQAGIYGQDMVPNILEHMSWGLSPEYCDILRQVFYDVSFLSVVETYGTENNFNAEKLAIAYRSGLSQLIIAELKKGL